jgi:hypothetical protein
LSNYSVAVLNDTPKAYYHLDETSGTSAADSSGNSHTGTYNGTPSLNQTSNLPFGGGTAVSFTTASSQYVTCSGAQVYSTSGYSIEFWVKANGSISGAYVFYGEGNSGSSNTILQFVSNAGANSSKLQIFMRNDAGTTLINNATSSAVMFPSAGNTPSAHHIVFTDNNGSWKLYVDGSQDSTGSYTPSTLTTNTSAIGALIRNTTGSFATATMDEVATYSTVLSSDRVLAHYNAGNSDTADGGGGGGATSGSASGGVNFPTAILIN